MKIMIKYISTLILLLPLFLVSCSDDNNPAQDETINEKQFKSQIAYNFWKLDRGVWLDKDGNMLETYDMDSKNTVMVYGVYFTDSYAVYLTHLYYRTQNRKSTLYDYVFNPKTSTVCSPDGSHKWNDFKILSVDGDEMTAETSYGVWITAGDDTPRTDVYYRGIFKRMEMSVMDFIESEIYKPQNFDSLP